MLNIYAILSDNKKVVQAVESIKDLDTKIIEAIDRIARVQRNLIWERAKMYGLYPLQAQILIYLAENKPENCIITKLSLEFGVSQPTISSSVKALIKKGLIKAITWEKNRHFKILVLTDAGKELLSKLMDWDYYLKKPLKTISEDEKINAFAFLLNYVVKLRNDKTLLLARACPLCKYYTFIDKGKYYCKLFNMEMGIKDLRINCSDFKEANP